MRSTRWLYAGAALVFALATSLGYAQGNGNGNGNGKGHGKHHRDGEDDDRDRDRGQRWYGDHDQEYRDWYRRHDERGDLPPGLAKRDRLPPGLERQLVRNGTLPPGLRKRFYRVPEDLERTLPPPPPDCAHVLISGHIVLLNTRNFQIVDVFNFER